MKLLFLIIIRWLNVFTFEFRVSHILILFEIMDRGRDATVIYIKATVDVDLLSIFENWLCLMVLLHRWFDPFVKLRNNDVFGI